MKERFSTEEWQELRFIPLTAFMLIAEADGTIDQEEAGAFIKEMGRGTAIGDELHRELAADIVPDVKGALATLGDIKEASGYIERTKWLLKSKLSAEEYQRFIASLFISAVRIAKASGGGFLGLGDKIGKEEKVALAAFARVWDLDPAAMSRYFG